MRLKVQVIETVGLVTDIIEDMYSPRTAAINFVSELVRKHNGGKENLQKFLAFVVEIFRRY